MRLTDLDKETILVAINSFSGNTSDKYADGMLDAISKLANKVSNNTVETTDDLVPSALFLVPILKKYNESLSRQVVNRFQSDSTKEDIRKRLSRCHLLWTTIQHDFDERVLGH